MQCARLALHRDRSISQVNDHEQFASIDHIACRKDETEGDHPDRWMFADRRVSTAEICGDAHKLQAITTVLINHKLIGKSSGFKLCLLCGKP